MYAHAHTNALLLQTKYEICHLLKLLIFWLYPGIFIVTFYVIANIQQ